MKNYKKISLLTIICYLVIVALINVSVIFLCNENNLGKEWLVEINRVEKYVENSGLYNVNLSDYKYVKNVEEFKLRNNEGLEEEELRFYMFINEFKLFLNSSENYVIRYINGSLYKIEYEIYSNIDINKMLLCINLPLALIATVMVIFMIFIQSKILKPFYILEKYPYELSKGNLTMPLKEDKNKFFGKFVWGLNMLREKLESDRKRELENEKDKKSMVLSLSHDIKTPLSAIKLYSKALSKELYKDKAKQLEVAESINEKADEVESFINEIVKSQREDFLEIPVEMNEFYLSELMDKIEGFYKDKLEVFKTEFTIQEYKNSLIKGDMDRSVEVLQNIMENAIKYGDGQLIEISVCYEENNCLVTVMNTGEIPDENDVNHIFESFYRGKNSEGVIGSGLGLYISRNLINKMEGEIFAMAKDNQMEVTVVFKIA